jgi:uncharacterized protein (UPF0332 family)
VTPDTEAFLWKARQFLDKGQAMRAAGWHDEAGRAAYLAGFHAAQAYIVRHDGAIPRTHAGVQTRFAFHAQRSGEFSLEARRFLSRAYALKAIADYEIAPSQPVTEDRALDALRDASDFVAAVDFVLRMEAERGT